MAGAAERAADELARLLDRCVSNVSELSSTSGDEPLITACLYQLQVRMRRPDSLLSNCTSAALAAEKN